MSRRRASYAEYLLSKHWARVKARTWRRFRGRCAICNGTTRPETHHRTYERIGREWAADTTLLCDECHELYEGAKKLRTGGGPGGSLSRIAARAPELQEAAR